jgi:hypothetical protein
MGKKCVVKLLPAAIVAIEGAIEFIGISFVNIA